MGTWQHLNICGLIPDSMATLQTTHTNVVISGFDYFFVSIKMVLITVIIITSRYDDYNFSMINAIMINMTWNKGADQQNLSHRPPSQPGIVAWFLSTISVLCLGWWSFTRLYKACNTVTKCVTESWLVL